MVRFVLAEKCFLFVSCSCGNAEKLNNISPKRIMARCLIMKIIASLFLSPRPIFPLTADCCVCFVLFYHKKFENLNLVLTASKLSERKSLGKES